MPSYVAFQASPLQTFWPAVVFVIAIAEVFSVFTFENPASRDADGNPIQPWTIKKDHYPGDIGFDPLGLKPSDPEELKAMQTKELNNGRKLPALDLTTSSLCSHPTSHICLPCHR